MKRQKVLFIQYNNPGAFPPLAHSSGILADAGWQVVILGVGDGKNSNALQFPYHPQIKTKLLRQCLPGRKQKLHYLWFAMWILAWVIYWRPIWIYASDSLVCPISFILSFFPKLKIIYHEHDSPSFSNGNYFQRAILKTRNMLAFRTQVCILPNRQRAERFEQEVGNISGERRLTSVVWNCPSIEEVSLKRSNRVQEDIWLLYHGTIVPPRLPLSVLESLLLVPSQIKLRIIGYETNGYPGYIDTLKKKASSLGISGRVQFIEAMPRKPLFEWCQKSDIGLAFMPRHSDDINMVAMVGASNKAFDYISCGLALLVSDLPDWQDVYVKPGYALSCDQENTLSLATAINWFFDHPQEMREMGEKGRQMIISTWNYQKQFQCIFDMMNKVDHEVRYAKRFSTKARS